MSAGQRRQLESIRERLRGAGVIDRRDVEGRPAGELDDWELLEIIGRSPDVTDEELLTIAGTRPGLPGAIIN